MRGRTGKIAVAGVMAALCVVLLYLAAILPTGQLGFAALGCLCGFVVVLEAGLGFALGQFAVCAALGLLLLPNKTVAFVYAAFFGYYPVVKSLAERIPSRVVEWIVKLAVCNGAFTVLYLLLKEAFVPSALETLPVWALYIALNVVFVLFDIGCSRLISLYLARVAGHFRKRS